MRRPEQLAAGLRELGLELPASAQAKALDFLALLQEWNRVYNLTGVRDPHEMVSRHLLDSFVITPFIAGRRVLDVGTGAGLPGIPLALALPGDEFVLLDSSSKKIRFVRHAVAVLGLDNVTAVCERVEQYSPPGGFDTVITRALTTVGRFLGMAGHLCARHGRILIMKGTYPAKELATLPVDYRVAQVEQLRVPGVRGDRHLVHIERSA